MPIKHLPDNCSKVKVTEKNIEFVVSVSESDINEGDFTAGLSHLHLDLFDSHP